MKGIQSQQQDLLMFVYRYFSVQLWALMRELGIKKRDAKDRAERLVKREMLQRIGTPYGDAYRLARQALPLFDLEKDSRRASKPSAAAIARDLAVLRYVFLSQKHRARLIRREIDEVCREFPQFPDKLKNHPYCWDADAKKLTCLRVPDDRSAKAVADELESELFDFENTKPFPALASNGQFSLVVLTFEELRAGAIRALLSPSKTIPLTFQSVPSDPEPVRS